MTRNPDGPSRGFWSAFAAGFVALTVVYVALHVAFGATLAPAVRGSLAALLPNALFGILSVTVAGRLQERGLGFVSAVAIHFALLLAFTLMVTATWQALVALDSVLQAEQFRSTPQALGWQTLINALIQLVLMAIGHAWHAAARAAQENERAARAEGLRARAQLALWRSQLNPHFVLNTLHALLGLVRREPARAETALERLGELLRFGLRVQHSELDQVTLREEWAFVGSYLALEELRLGERLRLAVHADRDALDCPVPPFAIQTLVENAILHAIAPRAGGGRLVLRAIRVDEQLHVEVEDDGPGVSEAEIRASPRLGLRILRDRLAALYAGRARLSFATLEGGGLRVLLELPMREVT